MRLITDLQFFSRVTPIDIMLFTKHLSIMIKSGITIAEALDTLESQTKSQKFKSVLAGVSKDIHNGQSLAKSLKKYPKVFNNFYVSLIKVGEDSGTLEENLKYLANQLGKDYRLRKKIQGTLLYPGIVLSALAIISAGMSIFVLPKFVELFASLDVKLPITTKILLFFATLMRDHGILVFAGIIILIVIFRYAISTSFIKPFWHKFLLRSPAFGHFLQSAQLASFCRDVGVMLKSGLTIRAALEIQYDITTNVIFKKYIYRIQKSVEKGKDLEKELNEENFEFISPIVIKMIGVGEKTGELDEVLLYLGDFFEEEVDTIAKNFSTILEPIILLVVGVIVGFIALAIISPIYQLTGAIKR